MLDNPGAAGRILALRIGAEWRPFGDVRCELGGRLLSAMQHEFGGYLEKVTETGEGT
jgi:hypothetical protein